MELKKTITSVFMVPTLKITKDGLRNNGFLNGYAKDIHREVQYENCIYLLFKPNNIDKFKDFLDNEYIRTKQVIDDYDYDDGFIVVVYELDSKWTKDFDLIKQGKYSKTSNAFQQLFPKKLEVVRNGKHQDEISLQWRVFKKTPDLKEYWENKLAVDFHDDMEVWDTWEEEKEILNLDKIKEVV